MNLSTETKFLIGAVLATIILIVGGVFFFSSKSQEQPATLGAQADNSVLLSNTNHTLGDPNAAVKIVEFADFQCPACATANPIVKKVVEENKDKVYFVYRHYPLPSHKNSKNAAQAAEAAANQGKFWEMNTMLYENQKDWAEKGNAKEIFEGYAQKLGLDMDQFSKDFDEGSDSIAKDYADGSKVGVNSTPTFFINGEKQVGALPESQFQDLINKANTSK